MEKDFFRKVNEIQKTLKAPKNQFNKFGGYKYRSCEDILEALKPLLGDLILNITDEVVLVGDRFYIRAMASLTDGKNTISSTGYAREPLNVKGMAESQITGASSSYARKYALNGLLCIDDTKDADSQDNSQGGHQNSGGHQDSQGIHQNGMKKPHPLTVRFQKCKEVLENDYYKILKTYGYKSISEVKGKEKILEILKMMESIAFPAQEIKEEFNGKVE